MMAHVSGVLECEQPNNSINTFQGVFKGVTLQNGRVNGGQDIALEGANLLLRGCVVRNTKWVMAVVCFTGEHTKVHLDPRSTRPLSRRRARTRLPASQRSVQRRRNAM